MKVKVGGVWKDVDPRVRASGAWKNVDQAWVKVGGAWKQGYNRYPVVSGGTLTADATYYYRTFTDSSTTGAVTGTLSIQFQPLAFDYVLVGGGGSGDAWPGHGVFAISANRSYYDAYFSLRTVVQGGSGGAGGVVSGNTTLNAGSYSIRVGAGGSNGSNGFQSRAFNDMVSALPGGAKGPTQAAGVAGSGGSYSAGPPPGSTPWTAPGPYSGTPGTSGQGNSGGNTTLNGTSTGCVHGIFFSNYCDFFGYCFENPSSGGGAGGAGLTGNGVAMVVPAYHSGSKGTGAEVICASSISTGVGGDFQSTAPGAGVTILGLTVGQAGDVVGRTRNAVFNPANTGAGGGATHIAGSGVLRIRYLRSAVGG